MASSRQEQVRAQAKQLLGCRKGRHQIGQLGSDYKAQFRTTLTKDAKSLGFATAIDFILSIPGVSRDGKNGGKTDVNYRQPVASGDAREPDTIALEDVRGPDATLQELIDACEEQELHAVGAGELCAEHGAPTHSGGGSVFARDDGELSRRMAGYFEFTRAGGGAAGEQQQRQRTALYTDPRNCAPTDVEMGLLGHMTEAPHTELFLNVTDPFCLVTVGVQGAGKSHTTNCVLEACLLPFPHVVQVRQPMAALVCHYDQSDVNCCEATGLAHVNREVARILRESTHGVSGSDGGGGGDDDEGADGDDETEDESSGADETSTPLPHHPPSPPAPCLDGDKLLVLCSPANFKQRKAFYNGVCTVKPLLFKWSWLNAAQIKMLMRLDESSEQLYVAVMLDKLRDYQRHGKVPKFDTFVTEFKAACSGSQSAPVEQRFQLLSSLVFESKQNEDIRDEGCDLADEMVAGRMVVADLTDPMMSPAEANGVFQVLLATFRTKRIDGAGKIVAFDEAHRYMGLNGESDALARSITDCARLMRHEGLRLLISTQSPKAMPEELLELTTVLIAHRYQSGDWHTYLSKKLPLPEDSFRHIRVLEPGEALVYSARPCIAESAEGPLEEVLRVQVRKRLTADRGTSHLNRVQKRPG